MQDQRRQKLILDMCAVGRNPEPVEKTPVWWFRELAHDTQLEEIKQRWDKATEISQIMWAADTLGGSEGEAVLHAQSDIQYLIKRLEAAEVVIDEHFEPVTTGEVAAINAWREVAQ